MHENILEVAEDIDILYATRIQKERFPDPMEYEKVQNAYQLDMDTLMQQSINLVPCRHTRTDSAKP